MERIKTWCSQSEEPWKSLLWQVTVWNLKTFSFSPRVSPSLSLPPTPGRNTCKLTARGHDHQTHGYHKLTETSERKGKKKKSNLENCTPKTKRVFFLCFHPCLLGSSCTLLGTINNSAITLIGCIFVDTGREALEVGGGGFQLQFNTLPLCHPSKSSFQPPCLVFVGGGKCWADRSISE